MVKQGPCCHCGVTSTPLWRNGPPEKPVLCNACGSRWRTKGSLRNYTPLHSREGIESNELNTSKFMTKRFNSKDHKLPKKKKDSAFLIEQKDSSFDHQNTQFTDQNFQRIFEGEKSNNSISGSTISNSESISYFGAGHASDLAGSAQSDAWVPLASSKRRTHVSRPKLSHLEKLTKDLYSIMDQSSHLSVSSDGDLLYDVGTMNSSFETGYGSMLIRHPNSESVDEDSEATSILINKQSCLPVEAYPRSELLPENFGSERSNPSCAQTKRDIFKQDALKEILSKDSPLASIELNSVINFETFMKYFTHKEQLRLLDFLPSVVSGSPESIKCLFGSPQFMEGMSTFQKLLREVVCDLSPSGSGSESIESLRSLISGDLTKLRHTELFKQPQHKNIKKSESSRIKENVGAIQASPRRPRDGQVNGHPGLPSSIRSPKRVRKCGVAVLPSATSELFIDAKEARLTESSICKSPHDPLSQPAAPPHPHDGKLDDVLLIEVPHNAPMPDAELLLSQR